MTRLLGAFAFALPALFAHATAHAHPTIDEARRRLAEADFEAAVAEFNRAEQSGQLSRDDLLLLLEGRAMARWAVGDEANGRSDLVALASLAPDRSLPAEAPPEVAQAFEAAKSDSPGALTASARWEERRGGPVLRVQIENDAAGIVRDVRVAIRVAGGAWEDREGAEVQVEAEPAQQVDAHVRVIGIGGAVIASVGSQLEPVTRTPNALAEEFAAGGDEGGGFPWLWVGVGAGVVAAGVVAAVLIAGSGSDVTQPSFPSVDWPMMMMMGP